MKSESKAGEGLNSGQSERLPAGRQGGRQTDEPSKETENGRQKQLPEKIKLSASIVTYNNVKYIETAVRTLLDSVNDEKIDFRLYIVDNGSSDGTAELLRERILSVPAYAEKTKLLCTEKNIGFGAAHNRVLDIIKKDFPSAYHCVVNPDVVIRDDILSRMTEFMEKKENSDVVLLSPKICFPDGRDQILGKRIPHFKYLLSSRLRGKTGISPLLCEYAMLDEDFTKPFPIENATGCFMFFRSSAFAAAGGFDERYFMYFEDCDITRTMLLSGRVLFFPDAVVYHVWARDSKRSLKLKLIHLLSMLKYYIKWRTF